jgi:hypothetical protein
VRAIVNDEHFDLWCESIVEAIEHPTSGVKALYRQLRSRQSSAHSRRRDGFPPASIKPYGARGGDPADPTGELASDFADRGTDRDPLNEAVRRLTQVVHTAFRELERAQSQALNTIPAEPAVEPGCESCARYVDPTTGRAHWSPIYEKAVSREMCRWCYDFTNAEGTWPPLSLVKYRADTGKNVTEAMVVEAMGRKSA